MDKAKGAIKKAAGKLPGIETEETQEGRSAREEGSTTGHQEYFRDLIEETNRRSESGWLRRTRKGRHRLRSGRQQRAAARSNERIRREVKGSVPRNKRARPVRVGVSDRAS